jgi:hypothetical protein
MTDLVIGAWVKRARGKWHVVESVVADRVVIRCGKEMARVTRSGGELQVSALMPLTRMIGQPQLCKAGCEDSAGDGAPEDDATAGQEDPVA